MHIVIIGRYPVPYPFSEHRFDYPKLKAWAGHMSRLDVIVQSQDNASHIWREANLIVHYAPGAKNFIRIPYFLLWALRRMMWIHKGEYIDVVNGSDLLGSTVGIFMKPWIKTKVIAHLQDEFIDPSPILYSTLRRKAMRGLAVFVCRHAEMIRCSYKAAAEQVVSLGIDSSRIAVIPSPCDPALFDPRRFYHRRKMGSKLLYVGSLVPRKGLRFLIKALPNVIRLFPSTTLTIVGRGSQDADLKKSVRIMGIAPHVKFLGHVSHDKLPQIMHQSNLFILPSLSEATPRVIMEAMAMELPVVATRVGGITEMVEDMRTGLIVQPGDSRQLADAICQVLSDPVWAKEAGQFGKQHVLTNYTLEQHIRRMVSLQYRVVQINNTI